MESRGAGPSSSTWVAQGEDQEQTEFPCCREGLAREQQRNAKQVEAVVFITLKKDEILAMFYLILLRIRTETQHGNMFTTNSDLYSLRLMLSTKKEQCPVDSHPGSAEATNVNSSDGPQHMPHAWGPLSIKRGKGRWVFTALLWWCRFICLSCSRWLCCFLYLECSSID